jgi:hypothetical protein
MAIAIRPASSMTVAASAAALASKDIGATEAVAQRIDQDGGVLGMARLRRFPHCTNAGRG